LGVLAGAKVVVNFWLRAGSGFCATSFFEFLEERQLPCVVAARLLRPIKSLITKGLVWQETQSTGTTVAEIEYQEAGWKAPRRLILIRHQVQEKRRVGGKRLIDCPGFLFQALVTSLPSSVSPLEAWRQYNGRAGIEGVIKELRHGYGLRQFCRQNFWATEAALSMGVMACNLVELFERFLGWSQRYAVSSLALSPFPVRRSHPSRRRSDHD
jgi:hypothetical protein